MPQTLKQLINQGVKEVYLRSYGYTEVSLFGNIWQPFGNKARLIRFTIDEDKELNNSTFWCEEYPTPTDEFTFENDKYISISDFDLCTRN